MKIFPRPAKKRKSTGFDVPDYLCYMAYIQIMLLRAKKLIQTRSKVNFVFAEKEETQKGYDTGRRSNAGICRTELPGRS